ncbi:MAG: cytochrome-c oxidase, cbb3-type subunit III [Burkholderiales bacterium]
MSDFTSDFWSLYIAIITIVSIAACAVLLKVMTTQRLSPGSKADLVGHVWDENLEEYNNPLPRWWMWLFYITIVFSIAYLVLYPGLGTFAGIKGWTSTGQFEGEQARAKQKFEPLYDMYAAMDVKAVAADPAAKEIGQRLFLNHCAQCHASDARGGQGFPNLADGDWLYGGEPEQIKASIASGRQGIMPPLGSVLGEQGVRDVAHYVMSLSGLTHDTLRSGRGQPLYQANCAACHGPEGKGNPALGAPNLSDKTWLYGGGESSIIKTVAGGRSGKMPAWGGFLGESKTHLVAAYIYGLSANK